MSQRVVITGMGVVSPVGSTVETFWKALVAGESGIGPITYFDTTNFGVKIAGEVKGFRIEDYVEPKEAKRLDKFLQYAIGAAAQAVAQSGLETYEELDKERVGVVVGCGIGGIATIEENRSVFMTRGPRRVSPFFVPMSIIDMAPGLISIRFGYQGPNYAVASACASAGHSLIDSANLIRLGKADVMICGGTEAAVTEVSIAGFHSAQALSTRNDEPTKASRPFDKGRDGFVMGEGAGIFVLESLEHAQRRGATILAEFAGYGTTGDAYHITAPLSDGSGSARAIREALRDAGITPADIDYVNAHGTSTPLNDKIETLSLKSALGEEHARRVSISSTKSMTGHLLGASAAIETVACVQAILTGTIPPTINREEDDPDCDLDTTPNVARKRDVRAALKTTLGFGGHNAALIFRRWNG